MDQRKHLPIIGVGPVIVIPQLILTVAGLILSEFLAIPCIKLGVFKFYGNIAGTLLILLGLYLWITANFKEKINEGIKSSNYCRRVRNDSQSYLQCIFFNMLRANT